MFENVKDICRIIKNGIINKIGREIQIEEMPISDGGDGFIECVALGLKDNLFIEQLYHEVLDPLLRPIKAKYIMNRENNTAFIEVANISGLVLLDKDQRNPFLASSFVS